MERPRHRKSSVKLSLFNLSVDTDRSDLHADASPYTSKDPSPRGIGHKNGTGYRNRGENYGGGNYEAENCSKSVDIDGLSELVEDLSAGYEDQIEQLKAEHRYKIDRLISANEHELDQLEKEVSMKSLEYELKIKKLQNQIRKLHEKAEEFKRVSEENKKLRQALCATEARIKELESSTEELVTTAQMTEIEKIHEVTNMRSEISELKKQLTHSQNLNEQTKVGPEEYAELADKLESLTKRLEVLIQTHAKDTEQHNNTDAAQAEIERYRRAAEAAEIRAKKAEARIEKTDKRLQDAKELQLKTQEEADKYRHTVAENDNEVTKMRREFGVMKRQLAEAQNVQKQTEADIKMRDKLASDVRYLKRQLAEAQKLQRESEDREYKARQKASENSLELKKLQAETSKLKKDLAYSDESLNRAEKRAEKHKEEAQKYKKKAEENTRSADKVKQLEKMLKREQALRLKLQKAKESEQAGLLQEFARLREENKAILEKYLQSQQTGQKILHIIEEHQAESNFMPGQVLDFTAKRIKKACEDLGVKPNASFEEISAAHKKWVQILHPDRLSQMNLEEMGNEEMKKINKAYGILKQCLANKSQIGEIRQYA
jgi:hypothetical protein